MEIEHSRSIHPVTQSRSKIRQRTVRFEILLTIKESEAWEALAESAGVSKAELVRRRMAGCRIKTVPEANWQTYWQLGKIGNNINQIAKAQNTAIADGLIPPPLDPIPFEALQRQIDRLRLHLILGMDSDDSDSDDNAIEDSDDWEE